MGINKGNNRQAVAACLLMRDRSVDSDASEKKRQLPLQVPKIASSLPLRATEHPSKRQGEGVSVRVSLSETCFSALHIIALDTVESNRW